MRRLGSGELRLLRRLAIDPSLRQASLAKDLEVSRSAVNQIWQNLESENGLRIRGNIDFGKTGLQMIFGWAYSKEGSDVLMKFSRWLSSSRLVTRSINSLISSTFDTRVYFEAMLPDDDQASWFNNQIERFRKKPYSLNIYTNKCSKISNHMNLGIFDGAFWNFPENFRLEASFGAARGYVDILPVVGTVNQSPLVRLNLDELIVASAIEKDYFTTASKLSEYYKKIGVQPDSPRTLRRKLARVRSQLASPYVDIDSVGLDQTLLVTIYDKAPEESPFSRVLHAQASTFPKARVTSGLHLTMLELDIPESVEWLTVSQVMSGLAGTSSETCTFIANRNEKRNRLESVVSYLASRTPSG
ncbi:MAG: hypothetical protein JW779_06980 [Candidatus Thorarchaeota archaeon]|nr:hypothetical protein [Candidatus Thorarchaeota archaeon]